ncbi:hypothetical protein LQW54_006372 [Pestalotiopsis sp. IQ-011]
MAQTTLEIEEEALGRWPRRLLHVPSLTSYEWKPGNIYGSWTEPPYNAITYTWGRWRLEEKDQPSVEALAVLNTPWKVPRVEPAAFTPAQILETLQQATRFYHQVDNASIPEKEILEPVEFVWLDVACIDQRSGEARSAAEIGRQALIFKNARQVFVWLSTIPTPKLSGILEGLCSLHEVANRIFLSRASYIPDQTPALAQIHSCIETLITDSWFTSLWTLQEAFLRPDAILFSREGVPIVNKDYEPYCHSFLDILGFFDEFFRGKTEERNVPEQYRKTQQLLRDAGLAVLPRLNALSAYTASGSRKATKDVDKFYGIQQIFGFRLGTSSLHADPGASYTEGELEIQFGRQLLHQYPVLSQMHVFTKTSPVGAGWLVSRSSNVPPELSGLIANEYLGMSHEEIPLCKLSVRKVEGTHWGHFSGKVCRFEQLHAASVKFEVSTQTWAIIHLDKTSEIPSVSNFTYRDGETIPQGKKQRELRQWLVQDFAQRDKLVVLLLGSHSDIDSDAGIEYHTVAAILLLQCRQKNGFEYYRRIGFCWWDPRSREEASSMTISAKSTNVLGDIPWKERQGYFG